jgi:hypothetical protein
MSLSENIFEGGGLIADQRLTISDISYRVTKYQSAKVQLFLIPYFLFKLKD